MAVKPVFLQRWSERLRALPAHGRRALAATAAVLALIVAFGLGVLAGRGGPPAGNAGAPELVKRNDDLQAQLAVLQRDRQVSQIADGLLQHNLADRDEEIRSLRADQAFYSKLVGADARPGGLTVHGIALTPIARTRAFNFTVTLTHSAEGGKEIQGRLSVAVEGIRADKLETLDWTQLGGPAAGSGLPFDFKYFQQVQGTLMLPQDFTPNRIRIMVAPQDGAAVTRTLAWSDALQGGAGIATATATD